MGKKLDITGETYGYAKAIRNTGKQYHGSYIWEFECTLCGKRFEAKIRDVRYGSVKSCGCWHRKNLDKMDTDEKFGHPVTRECRWLKEKEEKIPMLPIYTFKG